MIHFDRVSKRYPNGHIGLHELSFRAEIRSLPVTPVPARAP